MKKCDAVMANIDQEINQPGDSISDYAFAAALRDMLPNWKIHLKDGAPPSVVATDLKRLEARVRNFREELDRLLAD